MSEKSVRAGVIFALAAYFMWGIAPIYFKLLDHVSAMEVVMHRIFWSVPTLCLLLLIRKKLRQAFSSALNLRILKVLLFSGLLLAVNWLVFIWAVNNERMLDTSLGYFINPLFNVLLAKLFLQEILTRLQKLAVGVALLGVINLVVAYGELPWISLVLAITFSCYGLLRKKVAVESMPGLFIESLLMLPFALMYWILVRPENSNLLANSMELNSILIAAGIVTIAPLLCFTAAARRIRYTSLGFFQYLGPSIMFVLAVWFYKEPLDQEKILTFICVWSALLIYVYDSVRASRKLAKGVP